MANPYIITLLDPAGDLPLATADDTVEQIELAGESNMQLRVPLRGLDAIPTNRGGRKRALTLRVRRAASASPAAALFAIFEHERLLGLRTGSSLTLQFSGPGGFTVTFAAAVLTHHARAPGKCAHHDYEITAGAYTTTT